MSYIYSDIMLVIIYIYKFTQDINIFDKHAIMYTVYVYYSYI